MRPDSLNATVNQVCGHHMLCCNYGAEYAQPFLLAGILIEIQMSRECMVLHRQMYCSVSYWAASCI